MSHRKPTWLVKNTHELHKLCEEKGYEIAQLSPYHYRVLGAVAIVDIFPSRMKYNVLSIEGVEQPMNFRSMDQQFNKEQVISLLEKGEL